jgi:hypothetical protein
VLQTIHTLVVTMMLLPLLSGCNIVGFFAQAAGPPEVKSEFAPQGPILILAENYQDIAGTYIDAEQLEQYTAYELTAHGVGPLIDAGKLADLRASRARDFPKMSVAQVGRAAGARQVLYISIEKAAVDFAVGSGMYKGTGAANVKVVDAELGTVVWPTDSTGGRQVTVTSDMVRESETITASSVRQSVQRALADQIAKLFYTYKPE